MIHSFYDNTEKVASEATEAVKNGILRDIKGHERQIYQIGQNIDGNGFGFALGKIIDAYNDNGYCYYVVEFRRSIRAKKAYTKGLRQKDIKIL